MIETAQSAYRRKHLPPPSRANPLPDPEAVAAARILEELCTNIGQLEGVIRALPVPENDRMTQRHRLEAETVMTLCACDQRLVGLAAALQQTLEGKDYTSILANATAIQDGIAFMTSRVRERQLLLK